MTRTVLILSGPNLDLLGQREPEIYGTATLADHVAAAEARAAELDLGVEHLQSNGERELVEAVHRARGTAVAIVINPGAYSHTSVAILDALNAYEGPVIEVHISNIHKRETFRHHSYVSARAEAVIAGCGIQGYGFAVDRLGALLST